MEQLEKELYKLHYEFSKRDNASLVVLVNAYHGSRRINNAIAATILSFGDLHGPISKVVLFLLDGGVEMALNDIRLGKKIPGWGSSFDEPLELYNSIRSCIPSNILSNIDEISNALNMQANISCYTAAYALLNKIPLELCDSLIIKFRFSAWISTIQEAFKISWE